MIKYCKPRGTYDIYGEDIFYWNYIEDAIREITRKYNYKEIRTPIFEQYNLFERGVGESTDVVQKEIYDFYDKSKRHMALKPESTSCIIRSYIENKLYYRVNNYTKFYYLSPHFRYERQQYGRYRQHHQFGIEVFGKKNFLIDLEVITLAVEFLKTLKINNFKVIINNLGSLQTRQMYKRDLKEYFKSKISRLCYDCKNRLKVNPFRILDCKIDKDSPVILKAPNLLTYLDDKDIKSMQRIVKYLNSINVECTIDTSLVRGLDYYTGVVFEIQSTDMKNFNNLSLCGGGRYDNLVKELGGPDEVSGIGFGFGIERLILSLKNNEKINKEITTRSLYLADITSNASEVVFDMMIFLRRKYIVDMNYQKKSIKSIINFAVKNNYTDLVVIGDKEIKEKNLSYKNLISGKEKIITKEQLVKILDNE